MVKRTESRVNRLRLLLGICILSFILCFQMEGASGRQATRMHYQSIEGIRFFEDEDGLKADHAAYRCIGGKDFLLTLSNGESVLNFKNINNDGMVELWTEYYDGQENIVRLYQLSLTQKCDNDHRIPLQYVLELEHNSFSVVDINGDGNKEILLKSYTHPLYGSLYSRGRVIWEDIYELTPKLNLANSRHRSYFQEKQRQIESEIKILQEQKKNVAHMKPITNSEFDVHEVKVNEMADQIRVYNVWLKRIDEILK